MTRLVMLLWPIVGTVFAGVALMVIVTTPTLSDQAMKLIPILCGAAFVLALPVAYLVARRIADA